MSGVVIWAKVNRLYRYYLKLICLEFDILLCINTCRVVVVVQVGVMRPIIAGSGASLAPVLPQDVLLAKVL